MRRSPGQEPFLGCQARSPKACVSSPTRPWAWRAWAYVAGRHGILEATERGGGGEVWVGQTTPDRRLDCAVASDPRGVVAVLVAERQAVDALPDQVVRAVEDPRRVTLVHEV